MIRTLLFDMGGVVFLQDTREAFQRFTEIGVDARKYMGDYGQKGFFLALEKGEISADEFCDEISALIGRPVSWDEMQHCWLGFLKSVPADRLRTLEHLRGSYRVCLASNTNPFIMAYTRSPRFSGDSHGIVHYFDHLYCSYEMGVCKPDAEFFEKILAEEGITPSETVFVDDSRKNIEAAERLGIRGLLVEPDSDWTEPLEKLLSSLPSR